MPRFSRWIFTIQIGYTFIGKALDLFFTATAIAGDGIFIITNDITKPWLAGLAIQRVNDFNNLDLVHMTPLYTTPEKILGIDCESWIAG